MLLVNAAFVGGYGASRKTYSLVQNLREHDVDFKLSTDSVFLPKLRSFGLEPDIIIPWEEKPEDKYRSVQTTLAQVEYTAMMSLGWRTFVPYDAMKKNVPAIIIDGGWPEALQDYPGEFCHEVYKSLRAYCLTCHFPGPDHLLPQNSAINFKWISQPFGDSEIHWHHEVGRIPKAELRHSLVTDIPELKNLGKKKLVFLNMSSDYVDPGQLSWIGGWMTASQLDECRGFVTRLIVELSKTDTYILFLLESIKRQFLPVLSNFPLEVISHEFLDPETHHKLRCASDVVLCRAIRDVSSAQLALSGHQCVLHSIAPAREAYMGEWDSALYAQEMGIAKPVAHEKMSLLEIISDWNNSPEAEAISREATKVASDFAQKRGVEYLLKLLDL